MNPADEVAAKPGAAGSDEKSDQQLRTILESLGRVAHQDDLHSGFTPRLDLEALERKAIYDRLVAIENQMKRRGSRGGFARYLLAICIGVTAALAWQSYGEATKQVIATRAPELGWSPGAKQMIASWVQQLGWTKPPAGPENTAVRPSALETLQAAPAAAQTAPEPVVSKAPAASSLDPEQMQQLTRSLTTLQQTAEQIAAGQDEMKRAIVKLASGVVEVLVRLPAPPRPQPPAAPARKPTPTTPPSASRPPIAPPSSRTSIPPRQ
jgi:hypothetical protein